MRTFYPILLFCLAINTLFGQSVTRQIMGSWQTTSRGMDSSLLFNHEIVERQTFFFLPHKQFERCVYIFDPATSRHDTLIYTGFYKTDNRQNILQISDRNEIIINSGQYKAIDKFKSIVTFPTDSTMLLLNNVYKRTSLIPTSVPGERKPARVFYIQNLNNKEKEIKVINDRVQLQLNESKIGGEHLSRLNNLECVFDSIVGDSLRVTLIGEEIDIEYRNHFTSITNSYYAGKFNRVTKSLAVKDIMYLNIKNPLRQTLSSTGAVIMGLSILTIVSSPFAGMSLKGDARSSVRSQVFLTGVSGFVISIPFFIAGKNKKYGISEAYRTKEKNYWSLKQRYQ